MSSKADRWAPGFLAVAALLLCLSLVWMGGKLPHTSKKAGNEVDLSFLNTALGSGGNNELLQSAWLELTKLVAAALVGLLVATVHRRGHRERMVSRTLLQAQILLCVSGALMMIIIGTSVPRALGVAGGASIVRFRTPVEDPKDAMLLLLLLGLGMSVGLGAYAVCGLATLFICIFLVLLDRFGEHKPRSLILELVATTKDFPREHVHEVLGATVDFFEPSKLAHGTEAAVRYNVKLDPGTSLAYLSERLMDGGKAGLKSVTWEQPKKAD